MEDFGIQFCVRDPSRFTSLCALFHEIKKDKDANEFRDANEWQHLVPDDVKPNFEWPSNEDWKDWLERRPHTPIVIPRPSEQLGARWDFYRVFESIEESEYGLLSCELADIGTAQITIDPWGYPYGGVGPLIALAEAFGFTVLGVNECGEYETRDQLLRGRSQ